MRLAKGQIKPKADLHTVDSPKNEQTNLCFFAAKSKKEKKYKFFVCFFGESTALQSVYGFI